MRPIATPMLVLLWSGALTPSLALGGPYAQLEDARHRLEGGHPHDALETAEDVARSHPDRAIPAHLLAAEAEQALKRFEPARRRLRALWRSLDRDHPRGPQIRWQWARATALSGRHGIARRIAAPLRRGRDDVLVAKSLLARAVWRLDAHETTPAWRGVARALDRTPDDRALDVRAEAHGRRLAYAVEQAGDIPLSGGRVRARRRLTRRLAWLEAADREAHALLRIGRPAPLLRGLDRLAHGWRDLADELMDAPPPRRLSDAQAARYKLQIKRRAAGPLLRARDAVEAAIRVGERDRLPAHTPLAEHLRVTLDAIDARLRATQDPSPSSAPTEDLATTPP